MAAERHMTITKETGDNQFVFSFSTSTRALCVAEEDWIVYINGSDNFLQLNNNFVQDGWLCLFSHYYIYIYMRTFRARESPGPINIVSWIQLDPINGRICFNDDWHNGQII